jgi:hypothetical protein
MRVLSTTRSGWLRGAVDSRSPSQAWTHRLLLLHEAASEVRVDVYESLANQHPVEAESARAGHDVVGEPRVRVSEYEGTPGARRSYVSCGGALGHGSKAPPPDRKL